MTHCYGYRRKTRQKFSKGFRNHGTIHISKTLTAYKVGDIVDVVVDGAIHKGMPFKWYHGRTGRVFNVNPRSIGVIINKQVRNRFVQKPIHVRVEHLKLSTSRKEFLDRVRENDKKKADANKNKTRISTKRVVAQPYEEIKIEKPVYDWINPKIFVEIV